MKVRALKKTYYDKRDRLPGDVFEMDDRESVDIKILSALGTIEIVEQQASLPRSAMPKAAITSTEPYTSVPLTEPTEAAPMTTEDGALTVAPRRTYRRRDMRSET